MGFRSRDECKQVFGRAFETMSKDPQMGPMLRDAQMSLRLEFPDLDLVVNLSFEPEPEKRGNLRWTWSDDCEWDPDLNLTMNSDVANRYFQGKENVAVALARRRVKPSGNLSRALSLLPVTKPIFAVYRPMVEGDYPHLLVK